MSVPFNANQFRRSPWEEAIYNLIHTLAWKRTIKNPTTGQDVSDTVYTVMENSKKLSELAYVVKKKLAIKNNIKVLIFCIFFNLIYIMHHTFIKTSLSNFYKMWFIS